MAEVVVFGISLLVAGLVGLAVASVVFVIWIFVLPFQLLAVVFKGLGFVLILPLLLLLGVIGLSVFGFGLLIALLPLLPFIALAYVLWRLLRPRPQATSS
jgi:hypothetical protein